VDERILNADIKRSLERRLKTLNLTIEMWEQALADLLEDLCRCQETCSNL
jgi:hypothetical protein